MRVFDPARVSALILSLASFITANASASVTLWDTMKGDRAHWKKIPSNLMELEKEPLKAASDPGYYGREYKFIGDPVVENTKISATFQSDAGTMVLTTKTNAFSERAYLIGSISPVNENSQKSQIVTIDLIRNAADEVVLDIDFGNEKTATFAFGRDEIVEVKTSNSLQGIRFASNIDYGIVPGFVGDDAIYRADPDAGVNQLSIPSENMFVGLLYRKGAQIVMTWPKGNQKLRLLPGAEKGGFRAFAAVEIETAGESVFFAPAAAKAIWHREPLTVDHLEKDVAINWKPPFHAKWQTQLIEGAVKTTFAFRNTKGTVWRGVPGSYNYPVWFDGDKAMFSLSKKVPPKGEAIIYFLEGHDTPPDVLTPVDFLKATLGRQQAAAILDVEGRKLRTHHGPSGSNVHRACTCGYTEAIQAVFEKGEECDKKDFVAQSIDDMMYFVREHLDRIDEYRKFAAELTEYLQAKAKSNPELKDYLEDLDATVKQIPAEYENQKENMKSLEHAAELQKMTLALTARKEADNLKRYMELVKAWRAMGGAQDYVVAQYHTLTRKLFQDASYNAVSNPKAVEVVQEIRARCKKILRNPDGYEIWPNY